MAVAHIVVTQTSIANEHNFPPRIADESGT